jgi:hypothetical protein
MTIILDDDDSDIEIDEQHDHTSLKNLIQKLDIDTELIMVKPNSPIQICTAALNYSNLPETHIIIVNQISKSLLKQNNFFLG